METGGARHLRRDFGILLEAEHHPPLPFADLGLSRLFVNQPVEGRLTRACRPRRFGTRPNARG
nr:hypothetical protein SHINE37_41352 [Rhizobiaceae bacterium]